MTDTTDDNLAPPRDSVWTKYSPNHEFPLASATSIVVHVLLFLGVVLIGILLNRRWYGESSQPLSMSVGKLVEASAGSPDGGNPGGSPGTNAPGTEIVEPKQTPKDPLDATLPPPIVDSIKPMPFDFNLPDVPTFGDPTTANDINKKFDQLQKDLNIGSKPNANGDGGVGRGKGGKVGDGNTPGTGGPRGVPHGLSRSETLAQRWRFIPTGSPREHVEKLIAAGVRVGFKDGNQQFWLIDDLKKRPVEFRLEPFDKYKDTVKWYSQDSRSVHGMAVELQMAGPPQHFVLLLPQEREQKLAEAEAQFARSKNRDLRKIEETWFDFRPVGGVFVPSIFAQVPYDPRPKW